MRKSTFIGSAATARRAPSSGVIRPPEVAHAEDLFAVATAAADLAERAGVRWDPEEPELPARVLAMADPRPTLGWADSSPCPEAAMDVYREAAARYNAVGRLLVSLSDPGVFSAVPTPSGFLERKMRIADLYNWLQGAVETEREHLAQ